MTHKKKLGRPTTEIKSKVIQIRLTENQHEYINNIALRNNKTKTNLILDALEEVYGKTKKD